MRIYYCLLLTFYCLLFTAFTPAPLITHTGHIWFFSSTPLENIEAHSYQAGASLNPATGDLAFSVAVKGFQFKKALMQDHFNENYLESDKFPKATFKGKITDPGKVNFDKTGEYKVIVK